METQTTPGLEAVTNPLAMVGVFVGMAVFVVCVAVMIVALIGVFWKLGYFSAGFWRLGLREKGRLVRDNALGFWSNERVAMERRLLGGGLSYGILSLLAFSALIYFSGQSGG